MQVCSVLPGVVALRSNALRSLHGRLISNCLLNRENSIETIF